MFLGLTLLPALGLLGKISAQEASASAVSWAEWVTNDYTCVIGCLQTTFGSVTPPATTDQTSQAMNCVATTCSQETAQGNAYQATYIIQMWNMYGTIYEPVSWISNGGPLPTQQVVAVTSSSNGSIGTTISSGEPSAPTTHSSTGAVDTNIYSGSNPTGTTSMSVVNHGFTTSSISANASATGAVNGSGSSVNGIGGGNGTDSGADRGVAVGGLGLLAGGLTFVLASVGGGILFL